MNLTIAQLELINSFLVKNEVVFDDIRHEIIDHIACDLEENYSDKPFPEAVKIVLKKWENQVKPGSSFWITSWSCFPKISIKKLEQLSFPQIVFFALYIVVSSILNYFFTDMNASIIEYENLFKTIYSVWLVIVLFFSIKLIFTKPYTTYKYIFKRNIYMIYLSSIILYFGYLNGVTLINYLFLNLLFTVFLVKNYRAHFKFLKTY